MEISTDSIIAANQIGLGILIITTLLSNGYLLIKAMWRRKSDKRDKRDFKRLDDK